MTNQATVPDVRPHLSRQLIAFAELARRVDDDQLDLATPCSDFTVAGLLGHMISALDRMELVAQRRPIDWSLASEPGEPITDAPSAAARVAGAAARANAAWADDTLLDETLTVPWGDSPGAIAATTYLSEAIVHTWDLATATGLNANWPADDVVLGVLAGMKFGLPAERDDTVPFDHPTTPPAIATPVEQLAAWTGRHVPETK